MDGMAAVGDRIATIQRTLASLQAPGVARTTSSTTPGYGAGASASGAGGTASDFAAVLAAQTGGATAGSAAASSWAGSGAAGGVGVSGAAGVAGMAGSSGAAALGGPGAAGATSSAGPVAPLAGFTAEQLANARAVVEAGRAMGLSLRDQAIGVMTAMGESSLRVLDHGDAVGPDSRGLFQQRDNGAWGTYAQRMDPTASATSFFTALARVDGRDAMTPTRVAHTVQRNADPDHYTRYWDGAVRIVGHLTGATPAQITPAR